MRPFLVCNPGSRNRRSRTVIDLYRRLLEERGISYGWAFTNELDHAADLAAGAAGDGFDPVVAVGGDGTINRVVNGLLRNESPSAVLGVLYSGTSPDFCRHYGIPVIPESAVETLLEKEPGAIDICRITMRDGNGGEEIAYFASSANIGIGPLIASGANRYRRFLGDFGGTLLAAVLAILRGDQGTMILDGKTTCERVWNITVGKNPHLASGLRLDGEIAPEDGAMYLFAVHGVGRIRFLSLLPRAYSGNITGDKRFLLNSVKMAEITPNDPAVQAEFDGDPAGFGPFRIDVIPDALRLIGASS